MDNASALEAGLNELQTKLQLEVQTGREHSEYERRVHDAAAAVYAAIATICASGHEVWAHKGSGRILKMNSVGLFRRTRFTYSLTEGLKFSEDDEPHYELCELLAIARFQVDSPW